MTDFRKLFKPENFEQTFGYENQKMIVQIAQSILNEALDKATVVYASKAQFWQWTETKEAMDTHKALLINVEPIKECAHINYVPLFSIDGMFSDLGCVDCGSKVIPTGFKVKE